MQRLCTAEVLLIHSKKVQQWDESPDGGFAFAYKQQNNPIIYHDDVGPGAFAGEWITWRSEYLGRYQTSVTCISPDHERLITLDNADICERECLRLLYRRPSWLVDLVDPCPAVQQAELKRSGPRRANPIFQF